MEFHEKLQKLRKARGLTQEELAEVLFVSRTAVSKWESGRGYPGIDSLKELSNFFSVSIDDLLSGEQLIAIAEKENKSNISSICSFILAFADLFSVMLIFLPLYPKPVNGYVYAVNLLNYTENNAGIIKVYWALYSVLLLIGIVRILMNCFKIEKGRKLIASLSLTLGIITVLFLTMAKEPYAASVAFLLLLTKGVTIYKQAKTD